tara:strand:- start:49 stop:444 length:396 start_codon:yes stop_codon:yes gene_type:complete
MMKWFNYKGTISGKTYFFRSFIVGLPLLITYFFLHKSNPSAGSLFYFFILLIFYSFRYKRMSAVFKDKIDLGKKLFYITASLELLLAAYYLFNLELKGSEDFELIELIELPSAIFRMFIFFEDSEIKKHYG